MMQTLPRIQRRKSRGANLALLAGLGAMMIGLLGISLYTGLQAYLENDLQRVTSAAAMAGAASYYGTTASNGKPQADAVQARQIARDTFDLAINNASLRRFTPEIVNVASNDSNDSITVTSRARFKTPFLAVVGIEAVQANATATARALKYEPTQFTGAVSLLPDPAQPASYNRVIDLAFPLIDGPGSDLYVEQPFDQQRGYVVEACNNNQCYDLMAAARPIGTSQIRTVGGIPVLYGTAIFDLQQAGVRKANKLRFTHANNYDGFNQGVLLPPPATPTPTLINRVMLFGYAGTCVSPQSCPIPAGFMPVE